MAAFFQGTVALGILVRYYPKGADEMETDQVTQLPHDQEESSCGDTPASFITRSAPMTGTG